MKTDRELLELAAKAAGFESRWDQPHGARQGVLRVNVGDRWEMWDALVDDANALCLAVHLKMSMHVRDSFCWASARAPDGTRPEAFYSTADGADAALRRTIVQVAAMVGETMP